MTSSLVDYRPGFLASTADDVFTALRDQLAWTRHGTVPRLEYYVNRVPVAYTYGVAPFARTYQPQPTHPAIEVVRHLVQSSLGVALEVCFLNRYLDQSDHLGWHSDDSPEMDDARPIAIVSLGVERQIRFRQRDGATVLSLTLGHGSLCVMPPGMQDTHQHRIPKSGRQCGERISLTFRGYVVPQAAAT